MANRFKGMAPFCCNMAKQNVPIPAEIARKAAFGAVEEIKNERSNDRKLNARDVSRAASKALEAAAGQDGEFVSISNSDLRTLSAFTEDRDAAKVITQFREQFDAI